MLFVRSRDGISHSPAEFTDNDDIRQAVIALNSVVERLI
jgi:N-carbamoyl-L-amino-acid hydrolase